MGSRAQRAGCGRQYIIPPRRLSARRALDQQLGWQMPLVPDHWPQQLEQEQSLLLVHLTGNCTQASRWKSSRRHCFSGPAGIFSHCRTSLVCGWAIGETRLAVGSAAWTDEWLPVADSGRITAKAKTNAKNSLIVLDIIHSPFLRRRGGIACGVPMRCRSMPLSLADRKIRSDQSVSREPSIFGGVRSLMSPSF